MAPNRVPTSELYPHAWRQTAPSECKAGFPPDVIEERHENAINETSVDLGVVATKKSASPSTAREVRPK